VDEEEEAKEDGMTEEDEAMATGPDVVTIKEYP